MTANASSSSVTSRPESSANLPPAPAGGRPRRGPAPAAARHRPGSPAATSTCWSRCASWARARRPPCRPCGPRGAGRELAEALAVANRAYGNPEADRLAARLADPAVRVVVSGQQPGLLGGPLYSLAKMVAVSRWAAALEAAGAAGGRRLLGGDRGPRLGRGLLDRGARVRRAADLRPRPRPRAAGAGRHAHPGARGRGGAAAASARPCPASATPSGCGRSAAGTGRTPASARPSAG